MEFDDPQFLNVGRLLAGSFTKKETALASALHNQGRYRDVEMLHRPTLLTHTLRVESLLMRLGTTLDELSEWGQPSIDFDHFNAVTEAKIHDLEEIINDDWLTTTKELFNAEEKTTHARAERLGLVQVLNIILGITNPRIINRALDLYEEMREKNTPAAQLVELADKWDTLGEKCLEVFCDNDDFIPLFDSSRRRFQKLIDLPIMRYLRQDPTFDFDKIPDAQALARLPKIDRNMLTMGTNGYLTADGRYVGLEVLESGPILEWPSFFREWAYISGIIFPLHTKEFIFPGWYPDLGQKLGLIPSEL